MSQQSEPSLAPPQPVTRASFSSMGRSLADVAMEAQQQQQRQQQQTEESFLADQEVRAVLGAEAGAGAGLVRSVDNSPAASPAPGADSSDAVMRAAHMMRRKTTRKRLVAKSTVLSVWAPPKRASVAFSENGTGGPATKGMDQSAGGDQQGQNPANEESVSMFVRIREAIADHVHLPLAYGTNIRIFLCVAALCMALTIYYLIDLVVFAAINERRDPPGQFLISYEDRLETPAIKMCPDQFGVDITAAEQYNFQPICFISDTKYCPYAKVPDVFGDDPMKECYVFNIFDKVENTPYIFDNTSQSVTIVLFAKVDTKEEKFTYKGIPFVLYHESEHDANSELPRNGYIRFNTAAMATLTLDKHITIDGYQRWFFQSPGLTSLNLSPNFVTGVQGLLQGAPADQLQNYHLIVLNARYASLQVTITQEYYSLGPMEIIAAVGAVFSLGMGIMQIIYPPADRPPRRFIFDVVKQVREVIEYDDDEEVNERLPSLVESPSA